MSALTRSALWILTTCALAIALALLVGWLWMAAPGVVPLLLLYGLWIAKPMPSDSWDEALAELLGSNQ